MDGFNGLHVSLSHRACENQSGPTVTQPTDVSLAHSITLTQRVAGRAYLYRVRAGIVRHYSNYSIDLARPSLRRTLVSYNENPATPHDQGRPLYPFADAVNAVRKLVTRFQSLRLEISPQSGGAGNKSIMTYERSRNAWSHSASQPQYDSPIDGERADIKSTPCSNARLVELGLASHATTFIHA